MDRGITRRGDSTALGEVIRRHATPKRAALGSVWLIGLIIAFFMRGFEPTAVAQAEYEVKMDATEPKAQAVLTATIAEEQAYQRYYMTKGWFGRCDAACEVNRDAWEKATQQRQAQANSFEQAVSDARGTIGIQSTTANKEARELFSRSFNEGKKVAKDLTWWDMFFNAFSTAGSGEDSFWSFIILTIISFVWNMTLGMIVTLIGFSSSLYQLVTSYQAGLFLGTTYFVLGLLAATSYVLLILLCLCGTAGGSVAYAAKVANERRAERLQYRRGGYGYDPAYVGYGQGQYHTD